MLYSIFINVQVFGIHGTFVSWHFQSRISRGTCTDRSHMQCRIHGWQIVAKMAL